MARSNKGRGATRQARNPFERQWVSQDHAEGIDESNEPHQSTRVQQVYPKTAINKVDSPDIGFSYSVNPYQGCEHGCIYCYARNTHAYWGYNAGIDFEQKLLVKANLCALIKQAWSKPNWEVLPIILSGNTDCYQPIERHYQITRSVLALMLEHRHPVGIITKNALILRDLDLLSQLHVSNLVQASISITTLDEGLRQKMEPRTATIQQRFKVVRRLSEVGIPVRVMIAPVIPGLTDHDLPGIIEQAADCGAQAVSYQVVRLNGEIGALFQDWIEKQQPAKAIKVIRQVKDLHGGQLHDSRFGVRMKGEGQYSEMIKNVFDVAVKRCFTKNRLPSLNTSSFIPPVGKQQELF